MFDNQIKLNRSTEDNDDDSPRLKPTFRAAMRLAEKEEQELIQKIGKYHDKAVVQPIDHYEQEKSVLQHCLDIPSQDRHKKILKKIKAELTYLRCFQAHQHEGTPKEVLSIMKKDLDMLTAVISKFVHSKLYPKGSIVETVASHRNKIRVLLRGEMAVFEPINYKSFRNCKKFHETHNYSAIRETIKNVTEGSSIHFDIDQSGHLSFNPEEFELSDWQDLKKKSKTLSVQTAKRLLEVVNLITVTTPHRLSRHLKKEGELICSDIHQYIIDQPQVYQHTAICLNECYVMELQYEVYKQSIGHLNSDQQKKCIEILLRKFEHMDYFDAKEYVRNEFMINKRKEEEQQKLKQKQNPTPLTELEQCFRDNEGSPVYVPESDEEDQYERIYKKIVKNEQDLQTFEMKYENEMYLIIEGEVTLQIDIIEETRLSTLQYASKIRQRHPRSILKLYQGDLFGLEEIGKIKEYNLTYIVTKDTKLLLMNEQVYVRHYYEIEGFKNTIKNIQSKRNKLITNILNNIQKTVEQQQLKKYSSIASIVKHKLDGQATGIPNKKDITESLLSSHLKSPRQLQFVGKKEFDRQEEKVRQNVVKMKQGDSNGINLRQILQKSEDVNELLAFTSVYKINLPQNCQIVGDYIEVRNSKGTLLRRRAVTKDASQGNKKSTLLTRIGVINDKQRVDHNMEIVKRRKSKYEFQDMEKQKKQFKRLKNWTKSLPKLEHHYAKQEDRLYNHLNKNTYSKYL